MKRILFVAVVAVAFLGLMTSAAFAVGFGITSYPGTKQQGLTWEAAADGYYMQATGNPHGNFSATSHNCQVCHSVHSANPAGEALLMDTVANSCTYCHINPGDAGYIQIYAGQSAYYEGGLGNEETWDNGHQAGSAAPCTACHQVHAATNAMVTAANGYGATMTYLVDKLLKVSGSGNDLVNADIERVTFDGTESDSVAVSKWCTRCHVDQSGTYGYFNTRYGSRSHVMTDVHNNYTTTGSGAIGTIAEYASNACDSCHNQGETNASPDLSLGEPAATSDYNFPHYTLGVRFLSTVGGAAASDSHADGVCLNCHQNDHVTSSGIGVGF